MGKKLKFLTTFFLILVLGIIFQSWFSFTNTSSGDSGYYYASVFSERTHFLSAWMPERGDGLGGIYYPLFWSGFTVAIPLFLFGNILHSWSLIEKLAYYYPFLILGIFSPFILYKKVFPKSSFIFFSVFIFLTNTYALMVVGGGQLLIGLAYALMPLVILQGIYLANSITKQDTTFGKKILFSALFGGIFSIQVLLDIRIAYVTFFAIILFVLLTCSYKGMLKIIMTFFFMFLLPLMIVIFLHAFWIVPTLLSRQDPLQQLGSNYSSANAVTFFSFAKMENSMSLLHPNWPENIFGKVALFDWKFLFLPILAYCSLLFIRKKTKEEKQYIIFFSLLALIGTFLAKGAQDPFGGIYIWLFQHVPGFSLFRDPTKWFSLVALSYALLIPYSIEEIYFLIKGDKK